MDNLDEKREYIYNNISKIENHNHYIYLIKINNCPYTKNSNGFFINLTTTDKTVINDIYIRLNNDLNSDIINDNHIKDNQIKIENNIITKEHSIKSISNYSMININYFKENEQDIINYSKIYNL